jgi:steroid delta-isomerase-like uncharacterized protein
MAFDTSQQVTEEFLRDFIPRYAAAWNGRDSSAMVELTTPDVVWADPALPEPARGIDAVRAFMEASWQAFPDLDFDETDRPHLSIAGHRVAWAWRMRGTMRGSFDPPGFAPTGRRMEVEGVDLWEMEDGRIRRYAAFYDVAGLSRQLGLMPAPGSRAEKAAVVMQRLQARGLRRKAGV